MAAFVPAGGYRTEVQRGIVAAVGRVKEGDAQRALETELSASLELLEHAAHSAMAALLLVRVQRHCPKTASAMCSCYLQLRRR